MRPVNLDAEGRKRCSVCKERKHYTEFYPRYGESGKFTSACVICVNARARGKAAAKRVTTSTITIHPDGYALVSLHGKYGEGHFAKIDVEDVDLVSPYKWGLRGRAGSKNGYVRAVVGPLEDRRDISMHRLILGIHDEPFNQLQGEHKHHDLLDNRRSEIRKATPRQNGLNRRGYGASGFKGVYSVANSPNWQVNIPLRADLHLHLGTYAAKEDAARVYDGAARALFGEFAFTNFAALPVKQGSHPL